MGNQSQVFHGLNTGQIIIGAGAMTQINWSLGIPTSSSTNWAVQSQKVAGSLKFWIQKEKGLYYRCSKNKGSDHCAAIAQLICDLFSHGHKSGCHMTQLLVFEVQAGLINNKPFKDGPKHLEVQEVNYICSKNNQSDLLHSYCTAQLICARVSAILKQIFSCHSSYLFEKMWFKDDCK